jgi:nucleoside-diphosphate-sugar epimerase
VEALAHGLTGVVGLEDSPGDRVVRCLVVPHANAAELCAIGSKVQIVRGDLSDPECLVHFCRNGQGATLFHAASIIHPRSTREFSEVNTSGTAKLLQAALKMRVKRIIYVSSTSPCGACANRDQWFDEGAPYNPSSGYGKSKMLAEEIVKETGATGAIETVIARAPWFYGPGQPCRQTHFFRLVRAGRVPIIGKGDNLRSMVYVDNVCQGLVLCERAAQANGNIYWIADKRPYTFNEIVDTIERVMEVDFGLPCAHRRLRLPNWVSALAGGADAALQAIGCYSPHLHVLSEMNKTIACAVARANRELGYLPSIDLEEGTRRAISWALERGESLGEPARHE